MTTRAAALAAPGLALVFALAGITSGCAAGGARAGAASSPEEPEPTTLDEAQAQLDRSRALIEGTLGAPPAGAPGGGGPAGAAAPTVSPQAQPVPMTTSPPEAPQDANASDESGTTPGSRGACVTPCRAIASMRRAVAAICRMAGEPDARCTGARKTLSDAEARVAPCGC